MSAGAEAGGIGGWPWGLWLRQVLAVLRLEVKKNFLGRRSLPLYVLVMLPLFPLALVLMVAMMRGVSEPVQELGAAILFAWIYQAPILRFVLYLGCVWIFMNLFRGELLDRSLHYYFLVPIRREVLVAGKFLAGWIAATVLFGIATTIAFWLVRAMFGLADAPQDALAGLGTGQLAGYLGVTALACLGYGALFLLLGLLLRNPIVPALLIWIWEAGNFLMPAALKKLSVVHYLNGLMPFRLDDGPLAILAEPTPAIVAVPGLLLFALVLLVLSGLRIRRLEIQYTSD